MTKGKKKKVKKKVGRPTKYQAKFVDLEPYLAFCKSGGLPGLLPSITGYAVYLGVSEPTMTNWGKEHKEFFGSLRILLTISKHFLINYGLMGDWNSTIAKLILSSNHGMRERLDQTSDDKPITPQIIVFGTPSKADDDTD